ncbi:PQQ-dependent sugar dehydrogenase [Aurantibacter sp.]|uniref:PQQ-dependent sugar dehydrogenase n=1 Tax=Aurantibacter sp. TaxID=2807103 RepID=UPI0032645A2C
MNSANFWDKNWNNIVVLCLLCLVASCNNTEPYKRPSFEKPKFIIELAETRLLVSELERDLVQPWEITWGGDGHLWFTEKKGNVLRMDPNSGAVKKVLSIPEVFSEGYTPGLLGMVLHPEFMNNPYVYLHYTYTDSTLTNEFDRRGNPNYVKSRLVRYAYFNENDTLMESESIFHEIPGSRGHNGSRLTISDDNKLLFSIGDVANSRNAQTEESLPGKVLRINLDGSVPDDNPIPDSYFYSMGHRNPQGLVAANGKIYSSEHGPDNDDEINIIKAGGNYGWPFVEGYCDKENELTFCDTVAVTEPIYNWTPTIAPAGLDYYNNDAIPEWKNNLMLTTLKGRSLWLLELDESGERIINERIYLQKQFGRFRDLCVAPNGDVYIVTSNSDWHIGRYGWMYENVPENGNDRVLKISVIHESEVENFKDLKVLTEDNKPIEMFVQAKSGNDANGMFVYNNNCVSCHMKQGQGIPDFAPPLIGTKTVADKTKLIETVLFGMSGEIEVKGKKYNEIMPGFAVGLSNNELKDLLNFIRLTANDYTDSISVKEIEVIRNSRTL